MSRLLNAVMSGFWVYPLNPTLKFKSKIMEKAPRKGCFPGKPYQKRKNPLNLNFKRVKSA